MASPIRDFILAHIPEHPRDIARLVAQEYGISREASNRHIRRLLDEGFIVATGSTRGRRYELKDYVDETFVVSLEDSVDEDVEWRRRIMRYLRDQRENVVRICQFGFTEMVNNAVDHSESEDVTFSIRLNARRVEISIVDRGIGIFEKLRRHFDLEDARHAILELSKGKLTSDPGSHTGEGIFFASRMFDQFTIESGSLYFSRLNGKPNEDWLLDNSDWDRPGTRIVMTLALNSDRTTTEIFERFASSDEDWGFKKTIVPVDLARYEGELLVSRSQAKRLVARFDRFVEVILDFGGVADIGPAFADEIFRVYARTHPDVHLTPIRTTVSVRRLIDRALRAGDEPYQVPLP